MHPGDLVRPRQIDSEKFFVWNNPPGLHPTGTLFRKEIAIVLTLPRDGRVRIMTRNGIGWISSGLLEDIS